MLKIFFLFSSETGGFEVPRMRAKTNVAIDNLKNDKCSVEELAILFASTRHRASNFILESAGDPHEHLIRNLLLRCQLSTSGLQEGRELVCFRHHAIPNIQNSAWHTALLYQQSS